MATELAKAYVQIIPSTEGIKGKITEALGGEASAAGDAAGKTAGTSLVSTIKKVVIAAGIGTVLKEALSEGAALQQSLGGIETLFKDSADKVIANAENAYKTAGLSANEYMESVTSFSASLLQGLAGDTNKAADVADMALTDMADNANKMGTSMDLIQNAYQGFAKQNYTMLDNLKLGYGGTKTEMQRLLADAQKLTGVKYDMSNLGDVYEAIHVIQDEMGITGTTAKEAASTFSGSLASMKASFTNLLGDLTLGEDIQPSLRALTETVRVFVVNNLAPMIGNLLNSLPTLLDGLGTIMLQLINQIDVSELIPRVVELVTNLIGSLASNIPYFARAILDIIGEIWDSIINTDWASLAWQFVETIGGAFEGAMSESDFGDIFGTLWESWNTVWTEIGQPIFGAIQSVFGMFYEAIAEKMPEIQEFVTTCFSDIAVFWEENLKPCLDAIVNFISNVLAPIFTGVFSGVIKPAVDTAFTFIKNMWNGTLKPVLTGITDFLAGVFTLNFEQAWNGIVSILKGVVNGMISAIEGFVNLAITALNGLFGGINELAGKVGDVLGFSISIPSIPTLSLPRLANGGVLERGQVGLLEGSGAEAVVPLENNAKWISEVAKDMNAATGNNDLLEKMLDVLMEMKTASEETVEAIAQMKWEIDRREFARIVKAVN